MAGNAGNIAKMPHANIAIKHHAKSCLWAFHSVRHNVSIHMARPKKNTRPIVIDGRNFRYKIEGRNRYIGRAPGAVTISVYEDSDRPGTILRCVAVSSQCDEAEEECGYCNTSITPIDIEKIIRTGLARGWDPTTGTGTFDPGSITLQQYKV